VNLFAAVYSAYIVVVDRLVSVLVRYDVVAIQEIRDITETAVYDLLGVCVCVCVCVCICVRICVFLCLQKI